MSLDLIERIVPKKDWMKDYTFILVQSLSELEEIINKAIASNLCSLDLESTGLDTRVFNGKCKSHVVGYSLCFEPKIGYYIPIRHEVETEKGHNLDPIKVNALIQRLINECVIVGHNWLKFDIEMMFASEGIDLKKIGVGSDFPYHDTYILARLAGMSPAGLKYLSKKLLNKEMIEIDEVVAGGTQINFGSVSPYEGLLYAASDAICTYELYFLPEIQLPMKEQSYIYLIERKLMKVVRKLERNKIKLDKDHCVRLDKELVGRIREIETAIFAQAEEKTNGRIKQFQLDSPEEVSHIFFDLFDMNPKPEKSKKGFYLTNDEVLEKLAPNYPLAKKLQEYRMLTKFHRTYIKNMLINVDETGYLKFNFSALRTDSGRFASPGKNDEGESHDGYSGVNIQCLSGDTRVMIKNLGFIKIKEVSNKEVEVWDGEEYVKARCVPSGKKRKMSITFHNSQDFICSPDHRFLTRNETGTKTTWKKAEQFNKRESIVLSKEVPDFNNYIGIPENFVKTCHNKKFVTINTMRSQYALGLLLGRVGSDGVVSPNKRVEWLVAKHEYCILPEMESLVGQLGKYWLCQKTREGLQKNGKPFEEMTHINLDSAYLANQLHDLGVKFDIPEIVLTSKELLRGFLRGFFDGDGGISGNLIVLTFGSGDQKHNYAKSIQKALTLFGIQSRVRRYSESTRLRICRGSQEDFSKKIGFMNPDKQNLMEGIPLTKKLARHKRNVQNVRKVSISKEEIEMYDIVGCPNERFAADGFIVHNSTPARYDISKPNVRKCISCESDEVIAALDWSGVEIRIATNLSEEPIWLDRFLNGDGDLHTSTASIIYDKPELEVSKEERQVGKTFNFQSVYGGGPGALSSTLNIPLDDAKEKQQRFFGRLKGLRTFIRNLQQEAEKKGYCLTKFGRKRLLPEFLSDIPKIRANAARKATNTPIQGTAADLMKVAMIQIDNYIEENNLSDKVQLLLTMHDELVFRVKKTHVDVLLEIEKVMKLENLIQKIKWKVPLAVDVEIGSSWDVDFELKDMLTYLKTQGIDKVSAIYTSDEVYREHLKKCKEYKKAKKEEKKQEENKETSRVDKSKEDFKKTGDSLKEKRAEEVVEEKVIEEIVHSNEISATASEIDNAFKVLKEISLTDLPEEAYFKLKKSFYAKEHQRILEGRASVEDQDVEAVIVVHSPIDDAKKNMIGFIIDSCPGSGKIKFISQDKEELHEDWLTGDIIKASIMSKIFNI